MSYKAQNDEVFFCLSDLSNLVLTFKKSILSFACIFASICFFYTMLTNDIYQVSAKFSEIPERKEAHDLFDGLFSMNSSMSEKNKAQEMMQSKLVIEPVVKKLGLQASCYLKSKSTLLSFFQKYLKNLKREFKFASKESDPHFHFKDINYFRGSVKKYFIYFKSSSDFEIFDMKKKLKKVAKLNEKVVLDEVTFTLQKVPAKLKIGKAYVLSFAPIEASVGKIKKKLKIATSKYSNNVLDLTYNDFDPVLAQKTLNELMSSYVKYLGKENLLFAEEQFAYLEKRKKEVGCNLEKSLDTHAEYLADNLLKNGFMGLEQEVPSFTSPHSECLKKLFALDLELSHISVLNKTDSDFILTDEIVGKKLAEIGNQKSLLNQKKDALSMSLLSQQKLPFSFLSKNALSDISSENVANHLINIAHLRKEKEKVEKALDQLKEERSSNFSFFDGSLVKADQLTKIDLNRLLSQVKKALTTQEKILGARPVYAKGEGNTFEGLDIDTAKDLYISYNHKIDKIQAELKQLKIISQDIDKDDFEISTIITFFSDSVTQKLINQASDIQFKLNDENSIGEKDRKRLLEDLFLIRKFLKTHIAQMLVAKKSLEELYKNKLYALQVVTLDRTNQQISILDQQAKDYLFFRKESILKEKKLLQDQMKTIRSKMNTLPSKWKQEKLLQLKSDAALKMIHSLTNLIESKTIEHHLKKIASKPIELAELPKVPKSKRGIFVFVLMFFIGCFFATFYFFIQAVYKGFTATLDNLNAIGEIVLGEISFACDGPNIEYIQDSDLEALRNVIQFSEPLLDKPGSVLSLIGNSGPNYAHSLCSLISKIGKKVLLVELNFQAFHSDNEGLSQYLDGTLKDVPIQKLINYDLLFTGTTSRFGAEILRSSLFQEFLKEIKQKYDIIITYGKVNPISAEANTYLRFSNKLVVSFAGETVQALTNFFQKKEVIGFLKVKP